MSARVPLVVLVLVGVGLPLAISQLLPSNASDQGSAVVPLVILLGLGALAGWAVPTVRGWMATAAWVVLASVLVLLTWTDLVLNVAPSATPVDAWRTDAFAAIAGALVAVSAGFAVGAGVRRRAAPGQVRGSTILAIGAVGIACLAVAWLAAAAFSTTALVVQDDGRLITVTVTDTGIKVTPPTLDGGEYNVVYEATSSTSRVVASVVPLGAADGLQRAVTEREIAAVIAGDFATLEPSFRSAVSWLLVEPGDRHYGGTLELSPSPDGTGGALWYAAARDALREWPPGSDDSQPERVPWPVDFHSVVPVAGT